MAPMQDSRNIRLGTDIPVESYCDQPYVVQTEDGAWLLAVTTGVGVEGEPGQHLISMRSFDCGKTWQDIADVESAKNPESSYGVLYKTRYGRVYCFYNYNADNMRTVIADEKPTTRVDTLGHFVFKYSDDNGKSWSEKWYEIPQRKFQVDLNNPYGGEILFFWNVGKPVEWQDSVLVPLYKVGGFCWTSFMYNSEGVLLKCGNIHTERDPEKLRWETLPDGDVGIRTDRAISNVSEEHSFVRLSDDSLFCVFRTITGHSYCAYSRDGGHSFTAPEEMRYADGRLMKHPRAANFIWKCQNGKYLYWFHNHGGKSYADRNPVWLSGGQEYMASDGLRLRFSYPEIGLYDPDPKVRMSYPDLIECKGAYYLTETQKEEARVHLIDQRILAGLWGELPIPEDGTLLQDGSKMPALSLKREDGDSGFAFDFQLSSPKQGQVLFSSMDKGIGVEAVWSGKHICFTMADGRRASSWSSDEMDASTDNRITIIVDSGAGIISYVVNGILQDGGEERQFGFGRFDRELQEINGKAEIAVGTSVDNLRYYSRLLLTNEAISLQKQ